MSKAEAEDVRHKNHKVVRAFKDPLGNYCYRQTEIREKQVFDNTNIEFYAKRGDDYVYYKKPRNQITSSLSSGKGKYLRMKSGVCLSCGHYIREPALYCSISCKVHWLEQKEKSTGPEAKTKRKEIELGGGSEKSVIKKPKKIGGEGQESGAGGEEEGGREDDNQEELEEPEHVLSA